MKTLRFAVPIAVVVATISLSGLVLGFATVRSGIPEIRGGPTGQTTVKPTPTPLPPKSVGPSDANSASILGLGPTEPARVGKSPAWQGSGQGAVHTWQDGDRTMRVVLQDELTVQSTAENDAEDTVVMTRGGKSIVRKKGKHGDSPPPVFRSESGGGLMTLPGGVLLVLDSQWDQSAVNEFFYTNGVLRGSVAELDFLNNAFLVATEAGFPPLELANKLAGLKGVIYSSPNWQRELSLN